MGCGQEEDEERGDEDEEDCEDGREVGEASGNSDMLLVNLYIFC